MNSDLFEKNIRIHCTPEAQQALKCCLFFPSIASIHRYLVDHADHYPAGTLCIAETQTQGQGRMGRTWVSPPQTGIYCSYLYHLHTTHSCLPLGLVIAIALVQSLRAWQVPCEIKWPNDIWIDDKKLAGILIELLPGKRVIISYGLNMLPSFDNAADVSSYIAMQERTALVAANLDSILKNVAIFEQQGFSYFYEGWSSFDVLMHRPVRLSRPSGEIYDGIARGISTDGALLVEISGVLQAFVTADVSVRLAIEK